MTPIHDAAAFILAGGVRARMGRDKALLELGGIPLIVRTGKMLERLVGQVTVIGAPARYRPFGFRGIEDMRINGAKDEQRQGPLAGIATALASTSAAWNLLVACDLPYLSAPWLGWLLDRAIASPKQAVIPRTDAGLEPLAGVYRRECAAPVIASLLRGVRKTTEALASLDMELVTSREWSDPTGRVLMNMNAYEDYQEARAWWEAKESQERRDSTEMEPT